MNLSTGIISPFDIERDHHDFFMIEVDRFDQPMTRMLSEFLLKRYGADYWFVVDITGDQRIDAYLIGGIEEKDGSSFFHVYSVAVRRELEGQGWAIKLFDHLCMQLMKKAAHIDEIKLEVRENNERAIRFYTKYGFEHYSRDSDYYREGVDAILMKLHLK